MKARLSILLLLLLSLFQLSYAEKVDETSAKEKALQFLLKRKPNAAKSTSAESGGVSDLSLAKVQISHGDTVYYAFNDGSDGGFVVVSADDSTPTVLCYSDAGSFDTSNMPVAAREMLSKYAEYVNQAKQGKAVQVTMLPNQKPIYKLLNTQWGQSSPYNEKCPGVTGCVATALSQVMYYYKWPETGEGTKTYINKKNNKEITVTYGSDIYRYDLMLSMCNGGTSQTLDAVSTLMYHVGVAAEMQYGKDESGAFMDVALEGMKTHFKYDKSARMEYSSSYESSLWQNMLYNELAQGRPVVYSGNIRPSETEDNAGGHTYILDGFEDGYFHVNWGWNGSGDGYYLLTSMMGYNDGQSAMIGLKPIVEQSSTSDGLLRWGYCDDAVKPSYGGEGTIGGAIMIPSADLKPYIGKKIIGMEIGLAGEVNDVNYFVSNYLGSGVLCRGNIGVGRIGWNRIDFSTPVLVDGRNLFLGYTYVNNTGVFPTAGSTREDWYDVYEGATCRHLYNGEWHTDSKSYTLCIRAIFEKQEMPADMRLTSVENVTCHSTDEAFHIKGNIESMTSGMVDNYTVAYQIDDNAIQYYTVTCNMRTNELGRLSVPVSNNVGAGTHTLKVWIDKVNGMPDAVSVNSDYYKTHPVVLKVHGKTFERRNVMESYISTSCGFSPRAILADRMFREKYPDTYIGINIHEDIKYVDTMSHPDNYGGYSTPTTFINRNEVPNGHPSTLEQALSKESDFDIIMEPYFSADKKTLNIKSKVVPGMNVSGQYRMAYVITEDNVGPYTQADYGNVNYKWEDGDSTIYDGVARGIYPSIYGVTNSLPSTMAAGNTYEYNYTLTLPKNINDLDNINVIAMIVNYSTGEIENAYSMMPLLPGGTTLRFKKQSATMYLNEQLQLELTSVGLTPGAELEWSSSEPSVATVSSTGVVTALKMGTTIITVQVKNHPETKTTCKVHATIEKKWTFDETTGTLTVQGEGKMDFNAGSGIWDEFKDNIKHVIVGEGITSLPGSAFFMCDKIVDITLPSTLMSIGYTAFYGCRALENLEIPSSVTSIGYQALGYMSKLSTLHVNWTSLNEVELNTDAFRSTSTNDVILIVPKGCVDMYKQTTPWSGFLKIVEEGYVPIEKRWTFDETTGTLTIQGEGAMTFNAYDGIWDEFKDNIKHVIVGEGITSLPDYAFRMCDKIEDATLPSTLMSIGYSAFYGCRALENLEIPSSVTSIGYSALGYMSRLYTLHVNWTSLNEVELNTDAFRSTSTNDVILIVPKGCVDIYKQTTPWSGFLKIVEEGYVPIEKKWTFDETTGTLTVQGEGKMDFNAGSGIWDEFKDNIKHVIVGEGITSLPSQAFERCHQIKDVLLPSTLKTIGYNAFCLCRQLEEIIIPEGVETIGFGAFQVCTSLRKLVIPSSVKVIDSSVLYNSKLGELHVNWTVLNEVGLNEDAFKQFTTNDVILIVPKGCVDMYKQTAPWSEFFKIIEKGFEWTFDEITGTLTLKGQGEMPFTASNGIWDEYKDNIKHVVIDEGTTSLLEMAFYTCYNIETVSLPSTLEDIAFAVFWGCDKLSQIECAAPVAPTVNAESFKYLPQVGTLIVPEGADYSSWLAVLPEGWNIEYRIFVDVPHVKKLDDDAEIIYDLRGHRIKNPIKGNVYIVGGKKILK